MFGKQCLTFYDQSHLELYHIEDVKRSGNKLVACVSNLFDEAVLFCLILPANSPWEFF